MITDALLNGLPLPVVVITRDARILRMNARAIALFGPEVQGRHYMAALRQPEVAALLDRVLGGGPGGEARLVLTGPSRDSIFRVHVAALGDQGASLAFEDISDIEHAGEIRRDFVANVSHELRTPLTALLGFIETLQGPAREDPAARGRFLDIMEREALRMNRLVGDLLSLSRVEAEERVRPSEIVEIGPLVGSVASTLRGLAAEARVSVVIDCPPDLPEIPADHDQITQVLHNLIENAIKYGGSGGEVRIELRHDPASPAVRGPTVSVAVIDRGEGIDPIHLPRLTERFYRVDSHRSREKGGTGLGLAIVKHIVNRHRGRLRIDSTPGSGSRFEVILPAVPGR
ncbi:MAG: two-component sensor histidine kinase [Alphaproteobacteria bacterium]|nr:two-component sensor histidine kinase [Alphaproteobacteria bacterium]